MMPGWDTETKGQLLEAVKAIGPASPRDIAVRLRMSERSAVYWLTELARDGQVRITGIEIHPGEDGPGRSAAQAASPDPA